MEAIALILFTILATAFSVCACLNQARTVTITDKFAFPPATTTPSMIEGVRAARVGSALTLLGW